MKNLRFPAFLGIALLTCVVAYPNLGFAQSPQAEAPPAAAASESGALPRIERLEEQIVDLQGVVAAVETLAKTSGGGSGGAISGGTGGLSGDQFRQIAEQLADITQRIERLEARFGMTTPGAAERSSDVATLSPGSPPRDADRSYSATQLPPADAGQPSGFGTAIVPRREPPAEPSSRPWDASPGSVIGSGDTDTRPARTAIAPATGEATATAAITSGPARSLYDQGFGALQRREYRAAETYFTEFMKLYPSDALAGEAQFYLGEAAFQSAEFREAADHFLKAYSTYPASQKAPEALLKLAMSLRRLGENNAACDSFAELARRFPQAPPAVTQRAETEKRRANCV